MDWNIFCKQFNYNYPFGREEGQQLLVGAGVWTVAERLPGRDQDSLQSLADHQTVGAEEPAACTVDSSTFNMNNILHTVYN